MKSFLFKFIIIAFVWTSSAYSLDIISQTLINKKHKISWYFWETKEANNTYYLANGRISKNIRVWNFTADRKWRPIHNAISFNGFNKANKNFSSISFSAKGDKITFGRKTISKNISIDYYLEILKNKTFDIGWYFWESGSYSFLANGRVSDRGVSIWQFTSNGKWRPVHNALAYDGFPEVKEAFDVVEIDENGDNINIEQYIYDVPTPTNDISIPNGDNISPSFTIYSNDFKNGGIYAGGTFPHIRWSSPPLNTKSLAIEIVNSSASQFNNLHASIINISLDNNRTSITSSDLSNTAMKLRNDFNDGSSFSAPPANSVVIVHLYAISIDNATNILDAKNHSLKHSTILYRVE